MSPSGDLLDLSDAAKQLADSPKASTTSKAAKENAEDSAISLSQTDSNAQDAEQSSSLASSGTSGSSDLTPEEQQQISELQARDAEVRTHEAAHLAAAGQFATSGASYTYQTGPDGKKYAIGGEVSISTSPVKGDPQATLEKAQTIQRAALAPAEPSSQDQKVAAAAAQMAAKARQELTQQKATELQGSSGAEQNNALGADAEKSSSPSTNSAFQLIRKQAASTSAVTQSAASPSTYYSAQSTMSSTPSSSKGFSVYA